MDRKKFIGTSMLFGATAFAPGYTNPGKNPEKKFGLSAIEEIPNFCAHEHWGSITPIGFTSGGFLADLGAGALPTRRVTLVDLLLDPYMSGVLSGIGIMPGNFPAGNKAIDLNEMATVSPAEAFGLLSSVLGEFRLKGTYLCLRRGIGYAYGYDIEKEETDKILSVDKHIGDNYSRIFSWYKQLMEKARFSELIRPVQPEFYFSDTLSPAALNELSFTATVLRIDPFLDFWQDKNPRRDKLAAHLGIDPADAGSWRAFLEKLLDTAAQNSCIGIKQLQAYHRNLDFEKVKDSEVRFRGELSVPEIRKFQDWVVHECCRLANERKWPHQIHVGTHNLPESNPLPLEKLARAYPDQKIVMLHCWPYIEESGYLAGRFPNMFIDTCWQQVLNPMFLRKSMDTWLGYLPHSKITMSNDSTSIEMAVGSVLISKEILAETLLSQTGSNKLNEKDILSTA
ncbi:MAG: amidohydrolase family protein, partial [Bacteroidales bacterium]|nr:amidohydrolase family protein [Bacteroidales bacterium]